MDESGPGDLDHQPPSYPPRVLREYALLADGRRGALVGPRGDISWMCVPDWDSEAVFTNLLGGPGVYAVEPENQSSVWGGYYQFGSLIWTSRWVTTTGIIHCREALASPGREHRAVLLRRIEAIDGDAAVSVVLDARAGFGRQAMRDVHSEAGVWHARVGGLWLRWTGGHLARLDGDVFRARIRVPAGGHHDLILELSDRPLDTPAPGADEAWRTTGHHWRGTAPPLADCIAYSDAVHALAVLRGMGGPGRGTVAAATTSLPERAESERNYDYRYAWIRDQSFIGQAAAAAHAEALLDSSVSFLTARLLSDGPDLAPAYTAAGARIPSERLLDFLPGYPGARVRTGNRVNQQFQLDMFGECLLTLAAAARLDRVDSEAWRAMETAADTIRRRWHEPDAGMWELESRQWTHSKLICVAGLAAAARVAPGAAARRWSSLADTILADAARHGTHPSGRWQRAADDPRVDASLLLPSVRGGLSPDDPRVRATLAAVRSELERDGYVYRYRPDERPLGDAEGAFLLCGLSTALAIDQAGDPVGAARVFERNRAASGPAGLYCEEYDIQQRQLRGNLPQTFVHALLLQAAMTLTASGR